MMVMPSADNCTQRIGMVSENDLEKGVLAASTRHARKVDGYLGRHKDEPDVQERGACLSPGIRKW
jgi:hypothetical protein